MQAVAPEIAPDGARLVPGIGAEAGLDFRRTEDGTLIVCPVGDWLIEPNLPRAEAVDKELGEENPPPALRFNFEGIGEWKSGLVSFVFRCKELCARRKIAFDEESLPEGLRKLIHLAAAVPETTDAQHEPKPRSLVERVGRSALQSWSGLEVTSAFIGDDFLALGRFLKGAAQFRWSDVLAIMQQCGPQALGVVALINFLVGVILAFVGAVQLKQFGASIYVADLVAIGTVREMGCIMTGVILCGRTGAAFAAELGAMKVNEEIDAFRTFAISPLEFLVLPRIVALLVMMPILCVFADAIAIAGGYLVSTLMLDVTSTEYLRRTIEAITLQNFSLGIFKGGVFGAIVAVSGCLRGMQCGTNAAAVGQATTSAVVTGITTIVAADGIFAVLCNALNI
jgi:phospholipid/cholesterol/gamma-HCH transport system permease protein